MDDFLGEARGFEGADSDFKYILDSDVFHNVPMTDHLDSLSSSTYYECDYLFDDDPLVSTDKMVSGEPLSPATPHITCEHSYSLTSEPNSPCPKDIKQEVDDLDSNFGSDNLDEMLPISPETDDFHLPLLSSTAVPSTSDRPNQHLQRPNGQATSYLLMDKVTGAKSILTTGAGGNNRTLLTGLGDLTPIGVGGAATTTTLREKQEGSKIKLELVTTMNMDHGLDLKHHMPPTPPGSTASDSDGGESPQRSTPPSPRALAIQPAKKPVCHARTVMPQLFTNIQKLPQSGPLVLTEEEKRTLRQEGYPVPNKLPLSKAEEKSLKKVRRKIKNKISAQESRRKKKEYLEALEKRMDSYTSENSELRRKVETLETTNQSLSSQLTKLQSIVNKISKPIKANSTQTGTCLMVLVLCFAVFLGSWTPHSFLNSSNQSLHRLFSPSASVSPSSSPSSPHPKDLPSANPFLGPYGPYGLNDQYSDISDIAMDIDDHQGDQVFQKFGPQLVNDDAADPYGTHSMRSSRTLLSYHEDDEVMSRYLDDSSHAPLGDIVPQVPSFGKMAAAVMGSDVANLESDEGNYEAYLMHPDMEAKIIPVDTMALINRSANK